MHADVHRDILEDQWLEVGHAVVEELALELHDALRDQVEGPLALVDALDEPGRGAHLLLHVALGVAVGSFAEHLAVEIAHPQPRHAVVVEGDDQLVADLLDEDVGDDVADVALAEVAAGFGLEGGDVVRGVDDLRDGDAEFLRGPVVTFAFQQ